MVTTINPGVAPLSIATSSFDFRLAKHELGFGYIGGMNQVAPSGAGNTVRGRLSNPANSGITIRLLKLKLTAQTLNRIIMGPLTTPVVASLANTPTPRNKLGGGPAAKGIWSWDATQTITVATPIDQWILLANTFTEDLVGLVLPPNYYVEIDTLAVAVTDLVDMFADWTEY